MSADRADQQHRRIEVEGGLKILAEQGEPGVLRVVGHPFPRSRASETMSGHGLHVMDQFVDEDRHLCRVAAGPAVGKIDGAGGLVIERDYSIGGDACSVAIAHRDQFRAGQGDETRRARGARQVEIDLKPQREGVEKRRRVAYLALLCGSGQRRCGDGRETKGKRRDARGSAEHDDPPEAMTVSPEAATRWGPKS